ncbi:MAG TPA: mercury methylation corrinoid protein HgcA [Desulfobacteraceae bacterium]|nr:mercury methylation corrinoid protein HgcA [Desulfobacteraceae bacterium]HPJ67494.1 mercury methylation corrinoid protein HgcA [Desulfobacteraceae bacterium]HPQ29824.1 mercury methylation corrinoid protein HgcA [Desulfobacteraceae bacterium]
MSLPNLEQSFVNGTVPTEIGQVPRVLSNLTGADHWGSIKARLGVGRMHFTVDPGLYALGAPSPESPVLVTANYKMSFDRLREALPERDAWILVLDTKGINVWCAAGKGTFDTEELAYRIKSCELEKIVSHRKVILPQLAGPGIAAYKLKDQCEFKAVYGPIRAEDIPAFLDAGNKATREMRKKTFTTYERAVLIPLELVHIMKWILILCPLLFIISWLGSGRGFWDDSLTVGLLTVSGILAAVAAGGVITPLLLPWLPGRALTVKGFIMGLITAVILLFFRIGDLESWSGILYYFSWFFIAPAIAGYLAMNFTGSTTYTSLSGVKKEMKWAVPAEIGAGCAGLVLWLTSCVIS